MRSNVLILLMLLPATALCGQHKNLSACPNLRKILDRPVYNYSISEPNFVEALAHVASEFQLPMGIEWVRDRRTLKGLHLTWKSATVRGIVEAIVSTQPDYASDVEGCVVHVSPRTIAGSQDNFLNIKLKRFDAVSLYTGRVNGKLLNEVQSLVSPKPLSIKKGPHGSAGSIQIGAGERPMSFEMEDATVRQILDRIATASGFHVWVVTFSPDATLTRTGFRKTEWADGKPRANELQPIWEIVTWGTDPVGYVLRNDWPRPGARHH